MKGGGIRNNLISRKERKDTKIEETELRKEKHEGHERDLRKVFPLM